MTWGSGVGQAMVRNEAGVSRTMFRNALAFVCRVCPFCIVRRGFPESAYGRFMAKVESGCPFCRAYDAVEAEKAGKEGA